MAGQRKLAIPVGKVRHPGTHHVYRRPGVLARRGRVLLAGREQRGCFPLVSGDTLEIREDPEVVMVATIIREEAGDVLSDIDALKLARKIVKR